MRLDSIIEFFEDLPTPFSQISQLIGTILFLVFLPVIAGIALIVMLLYFAGLKSTGEKGAKDEPSNFDEGGGE